MMTDRHTRYQGLIVQGHMLLLIQGTILDSGHTFWLIPGGGREDGETEQDCVIREMKEETGLDVRVEKLVFDQPIQEPGGYRRLKSYLCRVTGGQAAPGEEPEVPGYAISGLRWVDLRQESGWGNEIRQDRYIYPQLVQLRRLLGYNSETPKA